MSNLNHCTGYQSPDNIARNHNHSDGMPLVHSRLYNSTAIGLRRVYPSSPQWLHIAMSSTHIVQTVVPQSSTSRLLQRDSSRYNWRSRCGRRETPATRGRYWYCRTSRPAGGTTLAVRGCCFDAMWREGWGYHPLNCSSVRGNHPPLARATTGLRWSLAHQGALQNMEIKNLIFDKLSSIFAQAVNLLKTNVEN